MAAGDEQTPTGSPSLEPPAPTMRGGKPWGRRATDRPGASDEFHLVAPSGAPVVRPDRLDAKSRARAMVPSAFTLTNMMLGFSSMRASQDGHLKLAAVLIAIAILFDIFDGAVARAVGAITPFGLQFDSIADVVSFGVAPATLLYYWSLHDFGAPGWIFSGFWLGCAAFRLARFNVTIDPAGDKRYFIGLASPGAAGVVIASVFAFSGNFHGWHRALPLAIAILPAAMMISPFRFTSFRFIASPRRDRIWVTVVVIVLLIIGLTFRPAITGLIVAYGYVAVAPIGWLTRPLRKRLFGPDSVAPPRRHLPSVFFLVEPEGDAAEEP
jgi:CDP-diacylglycerol--serine O-phosphatidyltransferase